MHRRIVEQNIATALVLEDDADWDIRIKTQSQDFTRASRLLMQPLVGTTDQFLDPTYPKPTEGSQDARDFDVNDHVTADPTTSPYGDLDRWDMPWLGHCGVRFAQASDLNTPLGRAVYFNDETVAETQHFDPQFGDKQLVE